MLHGRVEDTCCAISAAAGRNDVHACRGLFRNRKAGFAQCAKDIAQFLAHVRCFAVFIADMEQVRECEVEIIGKIISDGCDWVGAVRDALWWNDICQFYNPGEPEVC